MANQIVVSAGAKVRNLSGVLTGTSGVVSSVPLGAANGVATLDSGGKVPVSQLPSSVVTYLGTWNAATNTPTLVNGTGDAGDMYICNVAGTVNFGAGPVVFAVGDWVLYGSGTWQKSNGQNGTVTSVAASITGSAIGLTGSPITTAGTLAFAFAGTNLEYVNGAGNLTTFPTLTGFIPYTGATTAIDLNAKTVVNISHLGVNTTSVPTILIRAVGDNNSSSRIAMRGYSSDANSSSIRVTKFRGTVGAPQAPQSGDSLGKFELAGYGTTSSDGYPQASFEGLATESWGATARGTKVVIKVTPNTTITQAVALTINQDKSAVFENSITGTSLIKTGGTSSQFLKADGSVDSTSYQSALTLTTIGTSGAATLIGATLNIPNYAPDLSGYVTLATTQTITGAKTFSGAVTLTSSVTTNNITFANSGFFLTLQPPTLSVNRTVTLPNGTGTLALTSDISYPVTSVFGRTGAVVATSGDYTTTQVTEGTNLYYTDVRARAALSFVAGSGAYNSTTGVITIPTNNTQITNGSNYITLTSLSGSTGISYNNTTGAISSTITQYTDALARAALSFAAGSGAYNSTTGVITIPTDNSQIANGAGYITSSALSGYLPLTGGTLTGALGGTSASFSSTVTASGGLISTGSPNAYPLGELQFSLTTNNSFAGISTSGTGTTTLYFDHRATSNTGNFVFRNGTSAATTLLTIAGSGAATFLSSVTATSFIKTSGTSAQILAADGSVITAGTNITISGGTISSTGGGGGSITLSAIGSTPNANAATLTGSVLNLEPASASFGGVVTTGTQTFAGAKTFSPSVTAATAIARGTIFTPTLIAAANSDVLSGLFINPTFTNGSFTSITNYALNINGNSITNNPSGNKDAVYVTTNGNTRIQISSTAAGANFNTGFGLASGTTNKWSIASYGTNADFVFYNDATATNSLFITGNTNLIGINTTTVGSRLQVNGNAAIGYSASTAAPTNGLQVSGRVYFGLGQIGAQIEPLQIKTSDNAIVDVQSTTTTAYSGMNMYDSTGALGASFALGNSAATGFVNAMLLGPRLATGVLNFVRGTAATISATINASGDFGINTTTIGSKLQVNGNAAIGYSASTAAPTNGLAVSGNVALGLSSPSSATAKIQMVVAASGTNVACMDASNLSDASFTLSLRTGITELNAGGTGNMTFSNTAERMRITSGGNVLIGTTTDAGYKLYVDGGSSNGMAFYSTSAANQLKVAGTAPSITFSNTIASPTIGGVLGAATSIGDFFTGTAVGDMVLANQFSTGSLIFGTNNTKRMTIKVSGVINIANVPTSSAGLVTGDIYSTAGALMIV